MDWLNPVRALRDRGRGVAAPEIAGALVSLTVAVALYTRFDANDTLGRDEAIYAYAGQQLSHGVPVYASIFDPKSPLGGMFAGLAAAAAHLVGVDDLYAIRDAYLVCACLTVLAVYLLALRLWRSVLAGLVAAAVFASFRGFAVQAIAGPDPKMPGILSGILSMTLLIRRQWFWAAFAGSIGFLAWQPLAVYPFIAIVVAVLNSAAGERRRALGLALAGAALPVLVVTAYYWLAGALGKFIEAALVFPVAGIKRGPETVGDRLSHIAWVVNDDYEFSGVLFWVGLVLLLVLAASHVLRERADLGRALRAPLVCVVVATLLLIAGYSATDFQGSPDLFPLLPYAALGLGGTAVYSVDRLTAATLRRVAMAGALVAALALTAFSWSWFTDDRSHDHGLVAQRADACALKRLLGNSGTLYALGDPTSLVLTGRRNPDRFIYLDSGVDAWKIDHTPGGFEGWTAQIRAARPDVIVVGGWHGMLRPRMAAWLQSVYPRAYVGGWRVFLPGVQLNRTARTGVVTKVVNHVQLTATPTAFATGPTGARLPGTCG